MVELHCNSLNEEPIPALSPCWCSPTKKGACCILQRNGGLEVFLPPIPPVSLTSFFLQHSNHNGIVLLSHGCNRLLQMSTVTGSGGSGSMHRTFCCNFSARVQDSTKVGAHQRLASLMGHGFSHKNCNTYAF